MPIPAPQYSREAVNRAGRTLTQTNPPPDEYARAIEVMSNWRSSHAYPINTFQATLRERLKTIDPHAIVAQRLKRAPSIIAKLRREPSMNLARMQDIGGLRAVVASLSKVYALEERYKTTRFQHQLVDEDDYIIRPKASGYRSVHLIYKYRNNLTQDYNGLRIELQIRSQLQHAWATAVEVAGTFLNHALKASEGPKEWLRFFSLAGSAFAHLEKCNPIPGYEDLNNIDTYVRTAEEATRLDIKNRLQTFAMLTQHISEAQGNYHLITLNYPLQMVTVDSFGRRRLDEANAAYTKNEERIANGENIETVLVSTGAIGTLKRAYPNYFLDTHQFIHHLDKIIRNANDS